MFFVLALFCIPAGLIAFLSGLVDWVKELRFFSKAASVEGEVVGTIGAAFKVMADEGTGVAGTAIRMATGNSSSKEEVRQGGFFLRVSYEVGEFVYTFRSLQNFNELPEGNKVTVYYDPDNPKDATVGKFYSGNMVYYQMIGGGFLILLPFLVSLFVE